MYEGRSPNMTASSPSVFFTECRVEITVRPSFNRILNEFNRFSNDVNVRRFIRTACVRALVARFECATRADGNRDKDNVVGRGSRRERAGGRPVANLLLFGQRRATSRRSDAAERSDPVEAAGTHRPPQTVSSGPPRLTFRPVAESPVMPVPVPVPAHGHSVTAVAAGPISAAASDETRVVTASRVSAAAIETGDAVAVSWGPKSL